MKKRISILVLVFAFPLIFIMGCVGPRVGGPRPWTSIWDFYGEYRLTLPFEISNTHFAGFHYFDTDYSYEQMRDALIEAGYRAEIYEFDGRRELLIRVPHEGRTALFIIGSIVDEFFESFFLDWPALWVDRYLYLFPTHIMRTEFEVTSPQAARVGIHLGFEYFVDFYRVGGRSTDTTIDESAMSVTFVAVARYGQLGDPAGNPITMSFVIDGDGAYWIYLSTDTEDTWWVPT